MFEIDFSNPTWETYIGIHILYVLILVLFWRKYTNENKHVYSHYIFPLLFLIQLVFAFDSGDFYHYYNAVKYNDYHAMEEIYSVIGSFVDNNYILFRLVVWGSALLIFMKTASRLHLDSYRTTFFLFAAFISIFDYARASLAMSIFFFGLSYILSPSKFKAGSFLLGISLVVISVYFHNSMLVAILASIAVLIPINNKNIIFITITFFLSGAYLPYVLDNLVGANLFSEDINSRIEVYSVQEYDDYFSTFEWIRRYMEYGTFYIPFIIICYKHYFKKISLPKEYKNLTKITFAILLISLGVLLVPNLTFVLFYRVLFISMIPIVLLFCYCEQNNIISNKTYKRILYLGIAYLVFGFAKRVIGGNL